VADACGLDGVSLAEQAQGQPVKDRLRANTDEAIARGAFGSPSIFVDADHMYFGNDQLPLVRARLMAS
jgi:2-hydroxychromene-2-carboxylate isomerase